MAMKGSGLKDTAPPFGSLDLDRHAFFFDFDGTLAEIAPRPQDVVLSERLRRHLLRLHDLTEGAVAIITGRNRDEILALLGAELPVAGLHGLDFPQPDFPRTGAAFDTQEGGTQEGDPRDPRAGDPAAARRARAQAIRPWLEPLGRLVAAHPGTLLEDKGQGLALHWRGAPEAEPAMIDAARRVLEALGDGWQLQPGKCVAEIRPAGEDKGSALRRFLRIPPFRGRRPVAFGDDLNDLPMLSAAREAGGLAVAMGERDLPADLRLAGPDALAEWLERRLG